LENGEELMEFLLNRKQPSEKGSAVPACLLLDLKMPRKDGKEALWEIRHDPDYATLPILVLSTSDSEDDKQYCAGFGVSG
jgi:CheY-like chemotaxis protein